MKELFLIAQKKNIEIEYTRLPLTESLSTNDYGDVVLMDYSLIEAGAQERVHAAHEIGHCITGSFYNFYSMLDNRTKHEARANRWAIQNLVPLSALRLAVRQEFVDEWQLAEYFCVTPEFMRAALEYWTVTRGEIL